MSLIDLPLSSPAARLSEVALRGNNSFAFFLDMENQNQSNTNHALFKEKQQRSPIGDASGPGSVHGEAWRRAWTPFIPESSYHSAQRLWELDVALIWSPSAVPEAARRAWPVSCRGCHTRTVQFRIFMHNWILCSRLSRPSVPAPP